MKINQTRQIKESIQIIDINKWEQVDKRYLHYELLPYTNNRYRQYKHSNELQDFLDRHQVEYRVTWCQESSLHPLFADMFNGFMKG